MGIYLRNNKAGSTNPSIQIDSKNWDLDVLLEKLLKWLKENPDFDINNGEWIVDIGFEPRRDDAVAGYTISVELMELLSEKGITLWLSDYLNEKED